MCSTERETSVNPMILANLGRKYLLQFFMTYTCIINAFGRFAFLVP